MDGVLGYSERPVSVMASPATEAAMTRMPIIRLSIQMPRRSNRVRTLSMP